MGEKKHQQLWDMQDLIAYLKLPKSTVKFYVAIDKIPSIRIGRHRRFIPADVERALKKLST